MTIKSEEDCRWGHTGPALGIWLTVCTIALLQIGCSSKVRMPWGWQRIPYDANLRLQASPGGRFPEPLTIQLSEDLATKVDSVKPINVPGAMSYTFPIGESLTANLRNTVGSMFAEVDVSTAPMDQLKATGWVLTVALQDYDLHVAKTIFGEHSTHLIIQYSLYNPSGDQAFTITTDTAGSNSSTAFENLGRVLIPGEVMHQTGYRASIGRAYDEALAKSIDELVSRVQGARAAGHAKRRSA